MKTIFYIVLFLLIHCPLEALTQLVDSTKVISNTTIGIDTTNTVEKSRPILNKDGTRDFKNFNQKSKENLNPNKGIVSDTMPSIAKPSRTKKLKRSEDSLDSEVSYGAVDTQWLDVKTNELHLYGDAYVNYESYEIKAQYIKISLNEDIAFASSVKDENGNEIGKPSFSDGSQEVTYDKLKYNFKTKKGIVHNTVAQEGEFFLHGTRTKFVSKDSDSTYFEDQVFNSDAIITTCDHAIPHYGIHTKKLKLIPGRLAVMGPANLEIAGVPTPIVLPFGFFPIVDGISSGIIFPQDYDYSPARGFGLRDFGYYIPINDKVDLKITADYFTRGSYGLKLRSQYNNRYKYNGYFDLAFSDNRTESTETGLFDSRKSYRIDWTHNQDSKAHPYRSFSGGIHIETADYRAINLNAAEAQFENTYRSNMNFRHDMPSTPFKMTAAFSHTQNTQNNQVTVKFPVLTLNMNTINPFKRKSGSGQEKWYEKITFDYDSKAQSYVSTTDSTLFTKQVLDDIQYGVSQTVKTDASFRVLKYFNISPSASLDEIWFFRTLDRTLNTTPIIDSTFSEVNNEGDSLYVVDSTFVIDNEFVDGFKPYRKLRTGLSLNTQIFGTKSFKKGLIRGIRHVMKPTISFNYTPDTEERYTEFVDTDIRDELNDPLSYNPFSGGLYNASLQGEQKTLGFSLINIFEAKYWSKKDSTAKKFKIFDNVTMSGGYNFAADSLKWNPISIRGNARLFKGITTVNVQAGFSAYVKDENNRFINKTVWSESKKPIQFESLRTTISSRLTVKKIAEFFRSTKGKSDEDEAKSDEGRGGPSGQGAKSKKNNQASLLSILENISINHNIVFTGSKVYQSDTLFVSRHSIDMSGTIPLTDNWSINVQRLSYDIKSKNLVYPAFTLNRDLHCWRMTISWYPSSGTYSFFVGVKSNTLSFLKYNYGQNQFDSGVF